MKTLPGDMLYNFAEAAIGNERRGFPRQPPKAALKDEVNLWMTP